MPDDIQPESESTTTDTQDLSIDSVLAAMARESTDAETQANRLLLEELVNQLSDPDVKKRRTGDGSIDALATIEEWIAQIDKQMGKLMDEILHHERFRALERAWRGLWYLVSKTETSNKLRLRVLPVRRAELTADLKRAADFEQTSLFRMIYEEEYGTFGGDPYAAMITDFYFGANQADIDAMQRLSEIGASAHTPFIAASDPTMFQIDSYPDIGKRRDMAKVFDTSSYAAWRSYRETEDSRYLALTLPRYMLRPPYDPRNNPAIGFHYVETVDQHEDYCWGNAAFALGQRITNAYALYGWTAAIRGVEGGGKVENLPVYEYLDHGEKIVKVPTEVAITDRREKELSDLGFASLCYCKGENYAAFFGTPTTQKPLSYDTDAANANAYISAQLQYILAASRFAHYIKAMMRAKIGSFTTRAEVQSYLTRWLSAYVLLADDAPQAAKARFPLREARVDVADVPGKPGAYRAVVFLRPHFQLDELTASIRLVAELPPPAA